jgi:hypothetical protein
MSVLNMDAQDKGKDKHKDKGKDKIRARARVRVRARARTRALHGFHTFGFLWLRDEFVEQSEYIHVELSDVR